jgi:CheY-like chemotaxis protein
MGFERMETVLIVDDDRMLLTILSEGLHRYRHKFKVVTANDGLEAIKLMQSSSFSLVVTDIHMPKVNGLVLLAYINKNYPQIPCIVITGYGSPFLERKLRFETAHYIEKPFLIGELVQAIFDALDQEKLDGRISGISIAGFLRLIQMNFRTCLCEVNPAGGKNGYFVFKSGVLYQAFYDGLIGETAAIRMLLIENSPIKFRKLPKIRITRKINSDLMDLIREAERLKEDYRRLEEMSLKV